MKSTRIEETLIFIREKAALFGAIQDSDINKSYIERINTGEDALKDNGAYFGLIQPYEETSGPFHDFSLTIFPSSDDKAWLVCLGIGSQGFKNDYELSTYPGLRRLFSRIIDENGFCKSDFSDIQTSLPKNFLSKPSIQHIRNTVKKYTAVLPVCQIVNDPTNEDGKNIISAFLAAYAKMREWPTNSNHRKAISEALSQYTKPSTNNIEEEVKELLSERKYVILQGAPGTGKTRLAKTLGGILNAEIYFTQFHAETTYSDFIYGIKPKLDQVGLSYKESNGKFTEALDFAIKNPSKTTLLIIDEINRANLSNVLGQIFYLFEHKQDISNAAIDITPNLKLTHMPKNLLVIGTMNTADRSLAVVDFALKRRFAWYDIKPQAINSNKFHKGDFDEFDAIFQWYANSNELNLQPGQGYFIADNEGEMKNRVLYELYPLMREYLQEGLLISAKEEAQHILRKADRQKSV